jgi:hypothetical protein
MQMHELTVKLKGLTPEGERESKLINNMISMFISKMQEDVPRYRMLKKVFFGNFFV